MSEGQAQGPGRTQLKGLLDNLVQKSIGEAKDDGVDADVEEAARDLMVLTADDSSRGRKRKNVTSSASKPVVKRRKRRMRKDDRNHTPENGELSNGVRHTPHVMTLFDRKVDLAKFTPDTPLYVMCREWMSNNPDCKHSSTASQPHSLTTHTLPQPAPLVVDKYGHELRIDIPKPHPRISKSMQEFDDMIKKGTSEEAGDLTVFAKEHSKRWKEIRCRWQIAYAQNQLRYAASLKIIRGMFQKL